MGMPAKVEQNVPKITASPFEGKAYFYCYDNRDDKGLVRIQGNGICRGWHPAQAHANVPSHVITTVQEITSAQYDELAQLPDIYTRPKD